ncbi:isoleucine--tRNA ligase [Ornithinibacillus gellani]|uniref:isoleucine--tRNA ligase n=1 Tax=Ornithinibacillus gellani TaxID=2293253 RepID=UPI000F46E09C|nr:isoleucine--tRNA ligase [Ornithinibacillus gellani]
MKEANVEMERRWIDFWEREGTFEQSIRQREGKETFVFYEGPPTANGLPHAGHALGRTVKDFVARYKTMSGYQVYRKAGWDTHGLPVELEVEKQLGIHGKAGIEDYGVEEFIQACKDSVFAYEQEWKEFTKSLGYWVDMGHPYVTLQQDYIESVWHILSHIHQHDLLYKGHRVVPYCPNCETSLSSHEVAQGYKEVADLSATAKFRMHGEENVYLLGWTTTPWTLPGNVALAVHPEMEYVWAKQGDEVYIVAKALAANVLKADYTVVRTTKGKDLVGISYEAPFDFAKVEKGHQVLPADFVTDDSGTGVVHIAPAYGEDDYKLVQENDFDFVHVVNSKGRYTAEMGDLAGMFVKDADVSIIKLLAEKNLLFDKERYVHSYPHCWRCDSPLLYYAMEGWFIRTTAVKEQMQKNNQGVTWYPDHMKDGRFGNFLENMVDWNIGRSRYWGTPLNVWVCKTCGTEKAPGSLDELREFSVSPLPENMDLHKPVVDQVQLQCDCGGVMERVDEVIDVWFDSGSMPFAQYHYPFENKEQFAKQYPADVVIEGVDQTRGWFYSLLAVSTLYTGQSPYKQVLSLGHILDADGQKMSKSKGNALNPTELMEEFGADALRWALLADSSPWNNKRFSKQTVRQAKSKMIDTIMNVFSFYQMYAKIDGFSPDADQGGTKSVLDEWILSRLHTVIGDVTKRLDTFDITGAARLIAAFVDEVSNWYVRRSRQRFWGSGMSADKRAAFTTLHEVLTKTAQLLAAYTPFIAEEIYFTLTNESVHLSDFPTVDEDLINVRLEQEMAAVLQITELGRSARNAVAIKTKQPLASLVVISSGEGAEEVDLSAYTTILEDELNVKQITFETKAGDWIESTVKLDFSVAGPKFGKAVGEMKQAVQNLNKEEKERLLQAGELELSLHSGTTVKLTEADVQVEKTGKEGFAIAEGSQYVVLLDTELTKQLQDEGFVREVVRAVQSYRKELGLPVEERVDLYVQAIPEVQQRLQDFEVLLHRSLMLHDIYFAEKSEMKEFQVENQTVRLAIETA